MKIVCASKILCSDSCFTFGKKKKIKSCVSEFITSQDIETLEIIDNYKTEKGFKFKKNSKAIYWKGYVYGLLASNEIPLMIPLIDNTDYVDGDKDFDKFIVGVPKYIIK